MLYRRCVCNVIQAVGVTGSGAGVRAGSPGPLGRLEGSAGHSCDKETEGVRDLNPADVLELQHWWLLGYGQFPFSSKVGGTLEVVAVEEE